MIPTNDDRTTCFVRSLKDGESGQGSVNLVTRLGETVVRPLGPWSTAVHGLLNHLNAVGFRYAPKVLSVDHDQETESLSYIDGEAALRPWPPYLLRDDGLVAIASMLREYHDAVADYRPADGAIWRVPNLHWEEGMIIRHGDLGPWNMIWQSEELVGLIDWDLAEPGYPIQDVAQVARTCVPLTIQERCAEAGIEVDQQPKRLALLCETYSVDQALVLQALVEFQRNEINRTTMLGRAGVEPWDFFWRRGDVEKIETSMRWLLETYEIK